MSGQAGDLTTELTVEVTPEMIEAGVMAFLDVSDDYPSQLYGALEAGLVAALQAQASCQSTACKGTPEQVRGQLA